MNFTAFSGLGRVRSAFSILVLYAGKTSGILVNLIFLPIYTLVLGPEVFGIVAVIISLQALMLMLDLGMATLTGRDIAANDNSPNELLGQIFSAEMGLVICYSALLLVAIVLSLTGFHFGLNPFVPPTLVVFFLLLVLQNLHYNAIIARRVYTAASALQLVGNLVRGGVTAIVLTHVSPTLEAFVASQFAGALLQLLATRYICIQDFKRDVHYSEVVVKGNFWDSALALLRRAKSVALLSAAGAAVTQLDKPIISLFVGSSNVAPYFLAMTYCMMPMAVLAGPAAQFFQPLVINSVAAGEEKRAHQIMRMFTFTLMGITLLPSAVMYLYSDLLVGVWLREGPLVNSTVAYIHILLPGLAIGALGYIPYSLLLVTRDYKFMATLSVIMTTITLLAATLAASQKSVWMICVIYSTYHAGSTILQWIRASYKDEVKTLARSSSKPIFLLLIALFILALIL